MVHINKNVRNKKTKTKQNKTKTTSVKIQDSLQFETLLRSRTAILICCRIKQSAGRKSIKDLFGNGNTKDK